ncbi:MAG: SurA N-terminal domain-containing protein [Deltaproteobacteria bacterium]|nr:SurA N-terminal domain-containing protein [Deltaproteobacteria bacterium]
MLLSLMRKHAKSYLIKFLIGIIAVVFIFYFGYSFTSREGVQVASVNGEMISGVEYQKAYRNMLESLQREYKSVWSDNLIKVFNLKKRALQGIVDQKLISQEARRIGLDVTEKEVQKEILSYPAFQFKGRFDENRYRSLLHNMRMKPEDFEAGIAMDLLQKKLGQFLMAFTPVTEQTVRDFYTYSNEKVKISLVRFDPANYRSTVKVNEPSLEAFFTERREQYRIPEKVRIAYLCFDPESFKDQVQVTDQQVKNHYEENLEAFKEERQVKARHILFKLDEDASEEEAVKVRERAAAVLGEARKGGDFAALAKKHSEGPTREDGGDLGYFARGQMLKPFEDAAFEMKRGQISDPVRTPLGYHIIKVEDIKEERIQPLEEVRDQIQGIIANTAGTDLAHEKALSLLDQMPYEVDLAQFASDHKAPIKTTEYFSQDESIPDIGGDSKFRQSVFALGKSEVSELIEVQGKFYIIQVTDRKPSYLPELKEVRDRVEKDFIDHRATVEAKSNAESYLKRLKAGEAWAALAKEGRLSPETTEFFARSDTVPQIGHAPELKEAAFALGEEKRYPEKVFETEDGVLVIRWEASQGIDPAAFEEERQKYRYTVVLARHRGIFSDWLEDLRGRAQIEILQPLE